MGLSYLLTRQTRVAEFFLQIDGNFDAETEGIVYGMDGKHFRIFRNNESRYFIMHRKDPSKEIFPVSIVSHGVHRGVSVGAHFVSDYRLSDGLQSVPGLILDASRMELVESQVEREIPQEDKRKKPIIERVTQSRLERVPCALGDVFLTIACRYSRNII